MDIRIQITPTEFEKDSFEKEVPTQKSTSQVFFNSIKKFDRSLNNQIYSFSDEATLIKNLCKEWGLKEITIFTNVKSLKKLLGYIQKNELLREPVITMVNTYGITWFEKIDNFIDFQKQVLLFLGVSERAIGLDKELPSEVDPNDIQELYNFFALELPKKDKIVTLIDNNKKAIGIFFRGLKGFETINKINSTPFNVVEFYDDLNIIDHTYRGKLLEIMGNACQYIEMKPTTDKVYRSKENDHVYVVTENSDIFTPIVKIANGTSKTAFTLINVHKLVICDDFIFFSLKNDSIIQENKIVEDLQLTSSYVASPFKILQTGGRYYALQEKLNGLDKKTKDGSVLCYKDEFFIFKAFVQMLVALEGLHINDYIQGDFKPENFLFDSHNDAKLSDFGLSVKLLPNQTSVNVRQGSPFYMAPEVENYQYLTIKADSFSFGISVLEVICKKYKCKNCLEELYLPQKRTDDSIKEIIGTIYHELSIKFPIKDDKFEMIVHLLYLARDMVKIDPRQRLCCTDAVNDIKSFIKSKSNDAQFIKLNAEIDWDHKEFIFEI